MQVQKLARVQRGREPELHWLRLSWTTLVCVLAILALVALEREQCSGKSMLWMVLLVASSTRRGCSSGSSIEARDLQYG
jgi:hypothetical protein